MLARVRARSLGAVALLAAFTATAAPLHALGSKVPSGQVTMVVTSSARVMYTGSCQLKNESSPAPPLSLTLTVWDATDMTTVPLTVTPRPVLVDKKPTGEFVLSGQILLSELGLALLPDAARLRLGGTDDCVSLTLSVLVEDLLGNRPAFALITGR